MVFRLPWSVTPLVSLKTVLLWMLPHRRWAVQKKNATEGCEVWLVLSSRMSAGDMNKTKHWRAIWHQISLGLASSGPRLAHSYASLQRHAPWCPFPRGCALYTVFLVLLSSYLLVKVFLSPSLSSFPVSSVSSLPPQGRTCWTPAGGLEEGGFPTTWGCLVLPGYWPLLPCIQTFDVLLTSTSHSTVVFCKPSNHSRPTGVVPGFWTIFE